MHYLLVAASLLNSGDCDTRAAIDARLFARDMTPVATKPIPEGRVDLWKSQGTLYAIVVTDGRMRSCILGWREFQGRPFEAAPTLLPFDVPE